MQPPEHRSAPDTWFVLAVGRTGSLAAAGRELGVDSTTVGRRVNAIEKQLDARLFDRTNEGFVATERGTVVLERAEKIEREILAIESSVSGSADVAEGPVRITALDALFDHLIIPAVPSLLSSHPGLELTLISGFRMFDLSRFEAEVGIRMEAWAIAPVEMRHTSRVPVVLDFLRELFASNEELLLGSSQR